MKHEKILRMTHLSTDDGKRASVHFWICGTTYSNRNYLINRPLSEVSCIEYVVSGSGTVRINDMEFEVQAGDTYFLPQGHDHCYYAAQDNPFEKVWVNFSGELPNALIRLQGLSGHFHFPGLDTADLLHKFQYYAARRETAYAAEGCIALLEQLFFRMSQFLYAPGEGSQDPVSRMLAYIEQHTADPITLAQIAAVCGKSPSQAERLFRNRTGSSLYHYALDRKIELARRLLTETGMSVKEIASYLSFGDEFYFSGLFRRKVGLSPTQYRESGGKKLPSDQ